MAEIGRLGEFNGMSSQSHLPYCRVLACYHLANSMWWFQSYVSHCRVLPPGEFNGMSSQSHISHCRVLPLGEFTVTIPEQHATLQSAVTWRNQCHDRATLQGVRIPSAILKIVFAIFYFFKCSLGFDERRLSYRLRYTSKSWPSRHGGRHFNLLILNRISTRRRNGISRLATCRNWVVRHGLLVRRIELHKQW